MTELVAEVETTYGAEVGLAATAPNSTTAPVVVGSWTTGHAWSTIKVPLAIAALTRQPVGADAAAAITVSDNAAAQRLWDGLGSGDAAGQAVEVVLAQGGDTTTVVQRTRTRPEYTAFGQTNWSLSSQVQFAANFPTSPAAQTVWALMGNISGSQSWGLGRLPDAHFKGGWGPDNGGYTVRQFGSIAQGEGCVAVAIGTEAATFDTGVAVLNDLADGLAELSDQLPVGPCYQAI
ncbi:MAG: hypothetical protein LBL92_03785 [Propionibacteriaceae bacterium]|nr:hypothetical protein [Propionibacteriaceae bacterium]